MRVFKYRGGSFERDLQALRDNYFWAPTRDKLNDPCEGLFGKNDLDEDLNKIVHKYQLNGDMVKHVDAVRGSIEVLLSYVDKCGVYSLSQSPLDELLWAHYADSHKGFCIEYDLDKLVEFESDYQVVQVDYSNKPKSINFTDIRSSESISSFLQVAIGTKSYAWEYERELRVVPSVSGKHEYDYRAVKAVYFGLRMLDEEKFRIMDVMQGRGVSYFNIVLKNKTYEFAFEPIDDAFPNAKKYKGELAELPDYAITPDLVHENYKPFVGYLYKAAEIVRREPYCKRIDMVEFSATEGSPENPVIFVQYERKKNRVINHYLTIPEIEQQYSQLKGRD